MPTIDWIMLLVVIGGLGAIGYAFKFAMNIYRSGNSQKNISAGGDVVGGNKTTIRDEQTKRH